MADIEYHFGTYRLTGDVAGGFDTYAALGGIALSGQQAYDALQEIMNPTYDFSQFNFSDIKIAIGPGDGTLNSVLARSATKGGAAVSRGGAIGIAWYVVNELFVSAHVPDHSNWSCDIQP
ncbi:hypothetical protein [Chryseobacterium indologenes]|nr:hypothetical protein [Chryseobacterium indologenes]